MIRRFASRRFLAAAVLIALGAGVAFAATSLSGYTLLDQAEGGTGSTTSPSGFSGYTAFPTNAGGAGSSPSGYTAYVGPAAPVSTVSTSVGEWQTLND